MNMQVHSSSGRKLSSAASASLACVEGLPCVHGSRRQRPGQDSDCLTLRTRSPTSMLAFFAPSGVCDSVWGEKESVDPCPYWSVIGHSWIRWAISSTWIPAQVYLTSPCFGYKTHPVYKNSHAGSVFVLLQKKYMLIIDITNKYQKIKISLTYHNSQYLLFTLFLVC